MRSLLTKFTALCAVCFMILGFAAVPSASAQLYPPPPPQPFNCANLALGDIIFDGLIIEVTFPEGTIQCVVRIVIEVNPVLFDGPPNAFGVIRVPVPALEGNNHRVSVTVTDVNGKTLSMDTRIPPEILAAARAAAPAASTPAVAAVASVPAAQNLAFTGSSVNLPLAAGALLVGSGGLVLLAARKRERDI